MFENTSNSQRAIILGSRTERFAIFDGDRVVSRAYLRIPYGLGDKPCFIFKVKTNKSHIRQGLCRKVIEKVIESYGMYDIELRPHQTEEWGMTKEQLSKFYKSFGFKNKKNHTKIYATMRRNGIIT